MKKKEPAGIETTTLELRVPSEVGNERYAMDFSEDVAIQMGFQQEKIENLKIAVAEACLNAIEHGNSLNRNMKVIIDFTIGPSQLEINVQDKGKGFVPEEISRPDLKGKHVMRSQPILPRSSKICKVFFPPFDPLFNGNCLGRKRIAFFHNFSDMTA